MSNANTTINQGSVISGRVVRKLSKTDETTKTTKITGVLVRFPADKGHQTGLLHISKFAGSTHEENDARFAAMTEGKDGTEITAEIIEIGSDDKGRPTFKLSEQSLARKAALAAIAGKVVTGTVKGFAKKEDSQFPYGVFVSVTPFNDGLLHVSELNGTDRKAQNKRLDALVAGQTVQVLVREITGEGRKVRISLSEKDAAEALRAEKAVAAAAARAEQATALRPTLVAGDTVYMSKPIAEKAGGLVVLIEGCVEATLPAANLRSPLSSVKNSQGLKVVITEVGEAGIVVAQAPKR